MLTYIVENSSCESSIVLDCFCGSGTTLAAAKNCGRKWIGIDQSDLAIKIASDRLGERNIFDDSNFIFVDLSDKR